MRPTYPYVAQNTAAPTPAASNESLPTPEPIGGNNMSTGQPMMGSSEHERHHRHRGGPRLRPDHARLGGCGCNTGAIPGSCDGMGSAACAQTDYGISGYFDRYCGGRTWFGGVYYLFMDRTNPSNTRLASAFDVNNPDVPLLPAA